MADKVLCSIIMPNYNSEKYIARSIQSVLNQTFRDFEFIIIDDGSADKSLQIIGDFAKSDSRIKYYKNKQNMGVSATRNRGIDIAEGNYLAFIDSDDEWLPEKLERQIKILESDKDVSLVYSSYVIIDENDKEVKEKRVPETVTFSQLLKENFICLSSICFDKEVTINNLMSSKYFHEDYCFLLNGLRHNFKYRGISKILTRYRVSSQGRSFDKKNAAHYRWLIYRQFLHMSLIKSIYYFTWYFINGIKKYYIK